MTSCYLFQSSFILQSFFICLLLHTGLKECVWHVQEFELFGHAVDKKRWSPNDLLMFWSYDPKWTVLAHSSGKLDYFVQGLVKRYIKHRWNICRYYEKVFCRKNFVFEQLVLKKGFGNCSSLIFAIFFICGRMTVVLFQGRISYFTTGPFWTQYFDAEYIFMCEYPLKF